MVIMPELAVALRRELELVFAEQESEIVLLSTWTKARSVRAASYVLSLRQALGQTLPVVLWEKGEWARATAARDVIGGELTTSADIASEPQLWLFDAISIPGPVKKRFGLSEEVRTVGRVLLPVACPREGPEEQEAATTSAPLCGVAMGYLFRTPAQGRNEGIPFLRLLPDLFPGEFIADPHINFIAAYRYAMLHRKPVPAPGKGRVFRVG